MKKTEEKVFKLKTYGLCSILKEHNRTYFDVNTIIDESAYDNYIKTQTKLIPIVQIV